MKGLADVLMSERGHEDTILNSSSFLWSSVTGNYLNVLQSITAYIEGT